MFVPRSKGPPLTLDQIISSFMTLKEMHFKIVENKGENTGYEHFTFSYNVISPFRHKSLHLS